jgi:hypothetical protein
VLDLRHERWVVHAQAALLRPSAQGELLQGMFVYVVVVQGYNARADKGGRFKDGAIDFEEVQLSDFVIQSLDSVARASNTPDLVPPMP